MNTMTREMALKLLEGKDVYLTAEGKKELQRLVGEGVKA